LYAGFQAHTKRATVTLQTKIAIKKHGQSEVAGHGKLCLAGKMAVLFAGHPGMKGFLMFPIIIALPD
jgi:hypothetical protein